MLNQNKFLLQDLKSGFVVYCKPQKSNTHQYCRAVIKDKGSWAFKQAEDKHTRLFLKNVKNNLTNKFI